MRQFVFIILLLYPLLAFTNQPVYLTSLRIQPSSNVTHFTFNLSKKTYGKVKYLPNPDRVIVEFENTHKRFAIQNVKLGGANVISMRAEETLSGTLQFIFLVKGKVRWTTQFLSQDGEKGAVLQVDIISVEPQNKIKLQQNKHIIPEKKSQSIFSQHEILNNFFAELDDKNLKNDVHVFQANAAFSAKKPHIFTIVIDPGHGGKDPGARGEHGIEEKNVVLAIAKQLAKMINQEPTMRAILTRDGDYYLSLRERLKLARKYDADLFIAIHADAYFEENATGASVYALSQRGATSEAARWLAQRENYSEVDNIELNSLKDRSLMLRKVLIDLAQTTTTQESLRLGNKVLDALDTISSLHHKSVEQAPFVVLKSPDIPSILVETGFITNPHEERRLSDPAYQKKLSLALRQGIVKYVKKYGELRMSSNDSLSSPPFHSIVRHHLLLAGSHDPAYSKIDAVVG